MVRRKGHEVHLRSVLRCRRFVSVVDGFMCGNEC
jgi:hypothetical protein